LKYTYQIALLAKERFFPDEDFFHAFKYYDPDRNVSLDGRSRIITVELSKLEKVVENPAEAMNAQEHWAVFFEYLTDPKKRGKINEILKLEEGIAMASEVLLTISRDEVERARLESEYKYEVDLQSKIVYERRKERSKWQKVVADKDAEMARVVADKDAKLADKDVEIARLTADKDAEIARLTADKDAEIARLREQLK